jgi:chorismate-pyruvate lyase
LNVDPTKSEMANVEIDLLVDLFFEDHSKLGSFHEVSADVVPEPSQGLLAHDHHMTVTLEDHHEGPVDVQVLESRTDGEHYSRKILLTRQSDGVVVQYGIVRLNLGVLADEVKQEIIARKTPLGRILINHNVMRQVKLLNLYRFECGEALSGAFGLTTDTDEIPVVFGRTALIYCDGAPAIELLEIVG